jgi:hypothetical protein
MPTLEMSKHLSVQQNTAWLSLHKLMSAMADREAGRGLESLVEKDDANMGGRLHDLKAGRGSPNKVPFVLAVEKTLKGQLCGSWSVCRSVSESRSMPAGWKHIWHREAGWNPMACPAFVRPRSWDTTTGRWRSSGPGILNTTFDWSSTVLSNL